VQGLLIESRGPVAIIGEICRIETGFGNIICEVVGLRDEFESFSHGIGDGSFDSLAALLPSVCKSFAVARIRLQLSRGDVEDYARLCERIAKFIVTPDFTAGFLYPIGNFDDFRQITVLCGDAWEPQRAKCDLRDRLVKLQRVLRREFNEGAVMGVSQLRAGLGAVMTTEAQHAQDLRLCLPNVQGIYFYGDYEGQPSNAPHSLYSVFTKVLDTEGPEEVEAFLRRILCGMAGKAALSLRLCCVDIFCALANYCLKAGGDTRRFLGGHLLNGGLISGFDTLSELTDKICAVVSDILRQYPRPGAAGDLLANVKNNIDEHFEDNDICTESLSRQFHVSLGYLSAAFSKKYGISISKYINAKRIDYAASLLLNTDMPICAIAEQCGYNNESYFRRVFSSHKNCSPAKYRDRGTSGGVKAET
jgi:AraC-like DNA-binding protein